MHVRSRHSFIGQARPDDGDMNFYINTKLYMKFFILDEESLEIRVVCPLQFCQSNQSNQSVRVDSSEQPLDSDKLSGHLTFGYLLWREEDAEWAKVEKGRMKKSHVLMYSTPKVRNGIQATLQGRRL